VKLCLLISTPSIIAPLLNAGLALMRQLESTYILCVIITFVYLIAAVKLYADEILRIPEKPETKAGEQEDHVPDEEYYGD
uniref:hypothetical protein n=1 Tax=Coprococcus sp. TaxID=2049024 RepID=UPI0040261564